MISSPPNLSSIPTIGAIVQPVPGPTSKIVYLSLLKDLKCFIILDTNTVFMRLFAIITAGAAALITLRCSIVFPFNHSSVYDLVPKSYPTL